MERPFFDGRPVPMPESLWQALTPADSSYEVLSGPIEADVGIIGGGFLGLSTALHLAQKDTSAVVLEASQVGWGASGRNNGLIAPGLKRDPVDVVSRLGDAQGARLIEFSGDAPGKLFQLVSHLGIDCDSRRGGWIQAVHSRMATRAARARMEAWRKRDDNLEWIPSADVSARLGTDYYTAAWCDRRGGSLNPLAYVRGLATAASAAAAQIFCESPVTDIERAGSDWVLRTPNGQVTCRQVIICTNAYGDLPQTHARIMPIRTAQIASAPISETLLASILPEGESASDTQRLLTSFRKTADSRLIMGGASATAGSNEKPLLRWLHKAAADRFPQLKGVDWEFGWSGYLGLTANHLPIICKHEDGVFSACACNGRGIAMTTAVGEVLANLATGMPDSESAVPVRAAQKFFGFALREQGVAIAVPINRTLDNLSRLI